MRKLGWVLVAAVCPLVLNAATFGPETPVAPLQHSSAFGQQEANGIACGDQSCVALWIEDNGARRGLYSSVVNADGTVQPLSSNVLRLGSADYASIVWTGDHYLAMWLDAEGLVAAPLSRDGRFSGAIQTLMTNVPPNSVHTALAWNGRRAFAAFNTPDSLWMGILDENGNLVRPVTLQGDVSALGAEPKFVPPGPTYAVTAFDVAAAGLTFAVIWTETKQYDSTLKVLRYADDGSPLDHAPITLAQQPLYDFGIAGNATQFGIAYALGDSRLHRIRLDAWTGAVYTLPSVPFTSRMSGVYWSGDDFVSYGVESFRTFAIKTNRFSSNAFSTLKVSPSDWMGDAKIVPSATGALAVWSEGDDLTQHVFGALVDSDATAIEKGRLPVSVSALPQSAPALAASKSGGLLAWSQYRDGFRGDVVAQRVNADGAPTGDPIMLAEYGVNSSPATAVWTGNVYLVVWSDNGTVVGTRVSISGVVLDQPPRIFEHGGRQPVVVSNGTFSLLTIATGQGIECIRLDADGSTIDILPIKIASSGGYVSAASNGDEFLVTWSGTGGINAVRFTATGQLIDTAAIAIGAGTRPAVASDGRDFLIAYSDPRLVTKRLLAEGSLVGSTAQDHGTVVDAAGTSFTPSIAWDGGSYVVAWSVQYPDGWTVLSTIVDPAGAPADAPRVLGRNELSFFNVGAAVEAIQGSVVVAYSRGTAADNGIPRVFTREVLSGPPRGRGVRH